jgi:uncharacterized glyoxalase superfamily protein PhnB
MARLTGSSAVLLVADIDRSAAYYRDRLGCTCELIRVDDVEAIYAEFQRRGAPIDYTLYDAPSGFREFGVQDPDGHDIAVGQPIDHEPQTDG